MPFITIIDTVFQGRVTGWKDQDGKPIIYETEQEAQLDAQAQMEGEEADEVVEVSITDEEVKDVVTGRIYWTEGQS